MVRTVLAPRPDRGIRWVFLDRDGTLNVKPSPGEYVEHPDALELLPGAGEAVRMLNCAGMWTGVVTNQRGVALGLMSAEDLEAVHERLRFLLDLDGAYIDAIYACPHGLDQCTCRKPQPGLVLRAQSEHPTLDLSRAAIVGDSASDMLVGRRLGLMTILIDGEQQQPERPDIADHIVADPIQAAELLIASG